MENVRMLVLLNLDVQKPANLILYMKKAQQHEFVRNWPILLRRLWRRPRACALLDPSNRGDDLCSHYLLLEFLQ
jgi:hypothetical protein